MNWQIEERVTARTTQRRLDAAEPVCFHADGEKDTMAPIDASAEVA